MAPLLVAILGFGEHGGKGGTSLLPCASISWACPLMALVDLRQGFRDLPCPSLSYPRGLCQCWTSVTTKLCRGLQVLPPSTWPPDLLVPSLWEVCSPRASEGALPPSSSHPRSRFHTEAQHVGRGLGACWRQAERPPQGSVLLSQCRILRFNLWYPNRTW